MILFVLGKFVQEQTNNNQARTHICTHTHIHTHKRSQVAPYDDSWDKKEDKAPIDAPPGSAESSRKDSSWTPSRKFSPWTPVAKTPVSLTTAPEIHFHWQASGMGLFYIHVNVKVRLHAAGMGLFYTRVNVKALACGHSVVSLLQVR
jgi:hypothetical protein